MADEHQDQRTSEPATGPTGSAAPPVPPLGPNGTTGTSTEPVSPTGPTGPVFVQPQWPEPQRRPASAFGSQGISYAPPPLPLSEQISIASGHAGSIRPASQIVEFKIPTGPISDADAVEFSPAGADDVHSPDVIYSPTVELQTAAVDEVAAAVDEVDATVIRAAPASIGRVTLANRDAVLIQSTVVRLLLVEAIDRAKAERSNTTNVLPELEAVLAAVSDLDQLLLATTAPANEIVGVKALSFKASLVNLCNDEEVLKSSFYMALFGAGLALTAYFGIIPAVTVATLLRGDKMAEAIKALAKIGSQDSKE